MVAYPDPNAVGREAACAQALRNLMDFTLDRFPYQDALMTSGYGDRGLVDG